MILLSFFLIVPIVNAPFSTEIFGPLNCVPHVRPTLEDQLKWYDRANYSGLLTFL